MAEGTQPSPDEPRPVSRSRSELIRWMSIQDANSAGFVHGGVVMRMCDEAAGIASIRHCGRSPRSSAQISRAAVLFPTATLPPSAIRNGTWSGPSCRKAPCSAASARAASTRSASSLASGT